MEDDQVRQDPKPERDITVAFMTIKSKSGCKCIPYSAIPHCSQYHGQHTKKGQLLPTFLPNANTDQRKSMKGLIEGTYNRRESDDVGQNPVRRIQSATQVEPHDALKRVQTPQNHPKMQKNPSRPKSLHSYVLSIIAHATQIRPGHHFLNKTLKLVGSRKPSNTERKE